MAKCLWDKTRSPWQSRIVAGAGMALLMVATASGQFKRVPGAAQANMVACPAAGYLRYPQSMAVGPNALGSTLGTPWVPGTGKTSAGDYYVYWRQGTSRVRTDGAGLQIAVGARFPGGRDRIRSGWCAPGITCSNPAAGEATVEVTVTVGTLAATTRQIIDLQLSLT